MNDPNWYPREDERASRAETLSAWLGFICIGGTVTALLVWGGSW